MTEQALPSASLSHRQTSSWDDPEAYARHLVDYYARRRAVEHARRPALFETR
jgi:hypothetical protein